jgi:hypothetical protein
VTSVAANFAIEVGEDCPTGCALMIEDDRLWLAEQDETPIGTAGEYLRRGTKAAHEGNNRYFGYKPELVPASSSLDVRERMAKAHALGIAESVFVVAEALAKAHGGYGDLGPENWANFSGEATEAIDTLRAALVEHLKVVETAFGPAPDQAYLLDRVLTYLSSEPTEVGVRD